MIDISVNELVKSFEVGQTLLDGLSFDIHEGECVGIMGRNGCGKTTLFRLLTGELSPDSGEIHIAAGKKLGLISQIPVYPAGFSVEDVLRTAFVALASLKRRMEELEKTLEKDASRANLSEYDRLSNAYLTGGGYEQDTEVDKVCNGLGIPAEMRGREFDRLSGGEKTRVNLARLLLEKTDILLLDEPTNHLDLRSVEWLEDYIRHFKGTVLTISHDRYFLDQVVQRIIEISAGKAEFYSGNYSFYLEEKQERFNHQLRQYEQEQAKLKQLGFTVERMKGWGINNRVLYRRAMSIQHRMERIEKTERPTKEKTLRARFGEAASALRCSATTAPARRRSCACCSASCPRRERSSSARPSSRAICRRSSTLPTRSARSMTRCSMRRTARPRRRATASAHSCSPARTCSRPSARSPAASSRGCGCACSWMKKSICSCSTSRRTIWMSPRANGSNAPSRTTRAR